MTQRQPRKLQRYTAKQWETVDAEVGVEAPVSLTVNGEVWLTFMCTPADLEALAVGFLFNEGYLSTLDELASVRVCPGRTNVDAWLRRDVPRPTHWSRTSGCVGGSTSAVAGQAAGLNGAHAGQPAPLLPAEAVGRLMAQLLEAQELYREAGGVHSSALSDGHSITLLAEDIGRHNTLDKLAGRCLLERRLGQDSVLLTTGRVSSEMAQKALRLGIPIVISRTAPSSLAIDLADERGLTLIGYARRDRFSAYTHPERLTLATHGAANGAEDLAPPSPPSLKGSGGKSQCAGRGLERTLAGRRQS